MRSYRASVLCVTAGVILGSTAAALAYNCVAVGVLEENASKFSSATAVSEDGLWVVGNSRKTDLGGTLRTWPFRWSAATGIQDMGNPGGDSFVTGCASLWNGDMVACGNCNGLAQKWTGGTWTVLPENPTQASGNVRSVYCISRDPVSQEIWIGGSSYPAENEKAYRYKWSDNSYIDFWGYYQDVYGISHQGWAAGKNNWGNGSTNPDWAYDHPMFIFDWMNNCGGGGLCGWDQLPRFANYGEDQFFKGQARAISPSGRWVVGYLTYDPSNLGVFHAFKWPVPDPPVLNPEPWRIWPKPIDIGALPGDTISYAYCVSDTGTPVIGGTSWQAGRGEKAVYWDGIGVHDLYVTLQAGGVDMSRWASLGRVYGISANGIILAGYGYYDDDNNPATPVIQMGFVADLTDTRPPTIVQQPVPFYACSGSTAAFSIVASGTGPITYQWQKNQTNLSNGGHYSGVTTATLTVTFLDAGDVANYRCVATNTYGSTNSNEAALTIVAGVPAIPTDGTPTADATDRITWKWADVANENGYRVKDTGGTTLSTQAPGTTQWQEISLTPNTPYTRKISAYNGCGDSGVSAGQTRYTLPLAPTYGTGTTSPTVSCTQGLSNGNVAPNSAVTFTATNGFGAGANMVGKFSYLWDQNAGDPAGWGGEQFWTTGALQVLTGASGSWYLHVRSYNGDSPAGMNATVLNLGPYTVGSVSTCLQNNGFEEGFTSGVGNYWTKFVYTGDLANVTCTDETTGPYSGAHCQKISASSNATDGGIYQQFATVPGQTYQVSAYMKGSALNVVEVLMAWDNTGGTNPKGATVSAWFGRTAITWGRKGPYTVTAQSDRMTIFLRGHNPTSSASWSVWFDDVAPACVAPSAPTDGTPVALSTTSIRWVWSAASSAAGYRVKDTGGVNLSGDLAASPTQWDETTGVSPNTQYTRKVYAFNSFGESPGSAGQSRYSLIQAPVGVAFGTVTTMSIVASPSGTLANLTSGSSGVRTSNTTAGTDSGWQTTQSAWTSSPLAANTQYSFVARSRNGDGVETADCAAAARWTLSVPPAAGSVTPSNASPQTNESVEWTAAGGFGAGTVQYYRYAWDQSATHTWTGSEPQWSGGTLTTVPTLVGTWYLHVQGCNGEGLANGTYDYSVTATLATVQADFDRDGDVDLTDFSLFQTCFNGPNRGLKVGCATTSADLDNDQDVDLTDFSAFQACFNGPNRAPKCSS